MENQGQSEAATRIALLGIGTAGARSAYYVYQRGGLPGMRLAAVDSDPDSLAMLPSLECIQVPPPPALPVGAAATAQREAFGAQLEEFTGNSQLLVVLTFLGGATSGFYAQAALQYGRAHELPALALAAMPHANDREEVRHQAEDMLATLRAEHFEVVTLDCARFGRFFPDAAPEKAYAQAVRWQTECALGYLKLFTLPRASAEETPGPSDGSSRRPALNFDDIPRGVFSKSYPTIIDGENLDVPTYLRRGLKLPAPPNS